MRGMRKKEAKKLLELIGEYEYNRRIKNKIRYDDLPKFAKSKFCGNMTICKKCIEYEIGKEYIVDVIADFVTYEYNPDKKEMKLFVLASNGKAIVVYEKIVEVYETLMSEKPKGFIRLKKFVDVDLATINKEVLHVRIY